MAVSTGVGNAAVVTFTVDETAAVPESLPGQVFSADGITGKYAEFISLGASTFNANIVVNFSGYTLGSGGAGIQLTATQGEPAGTDFFYNLYALVNVTGNFTSAPDPGDPGRTIFDFDPLAATADVFIDWQRDTTKSTNPLGTTAGAGEDLHVLTAVGVDPTRSDGKVTVDAGGNVVTGSYALLFTNPTLVLPTGPIYWPTLASLSFTAVASGDVDPATGSFPTNVIGDTSIAFQVPEPASLGLFGLGLGWLGLAARRRRRMAN